MDFVIPTEGSDNFDKTILVDITDSYRTIKMTIFRPAPNMTKEAYGEDRVLQTTQLTFSSSFKLEQSKKTDAP